MIVFADDCQKSPELDLLRLVGFLNIEDAYLDPVWLVARGRKAILSHVWEQSCYRESMRDGVKIDIEIGNPFKLESPRWTPDVVAATYYTSNICRESR